MGSKRGIEFADAVQQGAIGLRQALQYHLTCNHYPPYPEAFVDTAVDAVLKVNGGMTTGSIDLPQGYQSSRYGASVPVAIVIDEWHLEPFLNRGDE